MRTLLVRAAALGGVAALFYGVDWSALQRAFAAVSTAALGLFGSDARVLELHGGVYLVSGGGLYPFTADCTYVDLAMILVIFAWRTDFALRANLARSAVAVLAVAAVDLVRISLGIHAMSGGASELWGHDIPDTLIYYPAVALAGWSALRRDLRPPPTRDPSCPVPMSAS